jgi:hypothetical protein
MVDIGLAHELRLRPMLFADVQQIQFEVQPAGKFSGVRQDYFGEFGAVERDQHSLVHVLSFTYRRNGLI